MDTDLARRTRLQSSVSLFTKLSKIGKNKRRHAPKRAIEPVHLEKQLRLSQDNDTKAEEIIKVAKSLETPVIPKHAATPPQSPAPLPAPPSPMLSPNSPSDNLFDMEPLLDFREESRYSVGVAKLPALPHPPELTRLTDEAFADFAKTLEARLMTVNPPPLYHCGATNPKRASHRPQGSKRVDIPDVFKRCPNGCDISEDYTPDKVPGTLSTIARYLRDGDKVVLSLPRIPSRLGIIRMYYVSGAPPHIYIEEYATTATYCCGVTWANACYLEAAHEGMISADEKSASEIVDQISFSSNCFRYMRVLDLNALMIEILQVHKIGVYIARHSCPHAGVAGLDVGTPEPETGRGRKAAPKDPPDSWTREFLQERFRREDDDRLGLKTVYDQNARAYISYLERMLAACSVVLNEIRPRAADPDQVDRWLV